MEMYTLDTAMIRLKEIAEGLESGEYDLEMSIKLYEEGVKIISFCNKTLSSARQKITELTENSLGENENESEIE
ncbi:MAG: exodeoxyribonuclease VII small subunit [Ruminococcaceae bacterium]|nr:exodeoxyribonuclease VII small subunit [Oscillospiraceae bacterium]MBQ9914071.1 exodeoxyribonuclease VII small subunit [Clostridia bacterium]